jgi:thiol-disulfide isomerase/thioredoxin
VSDFQQRLEAELLAAAQRRTRLRLARLPAVKRAGNATVGAVVLLVVAVMSAFLVTVRPDERSGSAAAGDAPRATTAVTAQTSIPGRHIVLPDVLEPRASTTLAGQGDRLTAVVFTASWCKPCIDQAPQLRTLVRHGVAVLLVSSLEPRADARQAARSSLRGAGRMVHDPGRRLGRAFGIRSYPEMVVIEGGAIRSRHPGKIDASVVRAVVRMER